MAYIRSLANGHFRADICMKGIVKNKTFPSKNIAQAWADKIEHTIRTIPIMNQRQLLSLSDADINDMGGEELFKQLDEAAIAENSHPIKQLKYNLKPSIRGIV